MSKELKVFLKGDESFLKEYPSLILFVKALVAIGAKPHLYTNSERITAANEIFLFSAAIRLLANPERVDGSYQGFCNNGTTAVGVVNLALNSLIKKPHIAVEEEGILQKYIFDPATFLFTADGISVVELD
ncbi:MAG: hypothetical protein MUD00_00270 [Candidatus Pacebacteria bacterium]|jgi:hypothetical protein|nr:hypothetical protein [Candidatus Paceibacterota bacterium]